jgi:hypothetical protein
MAGNTWEKRQREKTRRERKELKRAKRDEKRDGTADDEDGPSSEELMEQFAALNREKSEGTVDEATFIARRNEIWLAMGLPVD